MGWYFCLRIYFFIRAKVNLLLLRLWRDDILDSSGLDAAAGFAGVGGLEDGCVKVFALDEEAGVAVGEVVP